MQRLYNKIPNITESLFFGRARTIFLRRLGFSVLRLPFIDSNIFWIIQAESTGIGFPVKAIPSGD
ncbi:MAG: hypothetical protein CV087_20865 [Candidatus Brocadia sp. WS118]|nr:MAG: hypothetical protein CV087_20865 [Candidatus Brocadia sp. WS118]